MYINGTLLYPILGDKVLLGIKKKKVGAGLLNGFGGKPILTDGDNLRKTACRELYEETGEGLIVDESNVTARAIIRIFFFENTTDQPDWTVAVYTVKHWSGEASETEEMSFPVHYPIDNLPFDHMMPADRYFLPKIFGTEEQFIATYRYNIEKSGIVSETYEKTTLII